MVVIIAGLALFAFLGRKTLFPSEPSYQGKSLSAWAQQYGSNKWSNANPPATAEAELAIRQIGSNGIPFLLDQMQAGDSTFMPLLRTLMPRSWHDRYLLKDRSGDIRRVGAHGLAALGTNATAAVPALIHIATRHRDPDGRYLAVFTLRTLYSAAEPAIPFFIQCLTNWDATIRNEAAVGLANVSRQPEIAVPALIQYINRLQTPATPNSPWEIYSAINSLAEFGTNARLATPLLLTLLNDPSPEVREAANNTLPLIDAEAAAQAGAKRRQ